ncbi:MAG: BrnT family toxin [Deltaproteobacteria bacterium]|nr:BrnT family toxin [Deltaproteobacteria bacterium]
MKEITFDWDQWNIQKNEEKHGVSALEAESCFYDDKVRIYQDLKHSAFSEKRYLLYGKSLEGRVLMIGFTVRKGKIRIITARPSSRRERRIYEAKGS